MPSTVVHLALGALVGAALLGEEFDGRALLVVLAAAAAPDLDTFLGIVVLGTHRAALHTLLVPAAAAALLAYGTRVRDRPWLAGRTVVLAWVGIGVYAIAGIGPDLFTNGANVLYPVHDRFYALSGDVLVSNRRGIVQTIWRPEAAGGTTATAHYATGVDVARGADPANVERVFPVARGGLQALVVLAGVLVTAVRLGRNRRG